MNANRKLWIRDSKSCAGRLHLMAIHGLLMPPTKLDFLHLNKVLRIDQPILQRGK